MQYEHYYDSLDSSGKQELAGRLDTSLAYLSQLRHQHRFAGSKILLAIHQATDGEVSPWEMPRRAQVQVA